MATDVLATDILASNSPPEDVLAARKTCRNKNIYYVRLSYLFVRSFLGQNIHLRFDEGNEEGMDGDDEEEEEKMVAKRRKRRKD